MKLSRSFPISLLLAGRNLFRDRIRLITTLIGIIFSVVLVTVELGLFMGFERTVTMMIDHARADIWIGPAQTKSFEARITQPHKPHPFFWRTFTPSTYGNFH